MLLVGEYKNIHYIDNRNLVVFNYSSLNEGYQKLNLMPPFDVDFMDFKTFDLKYADWIINNDEPFIRFFQIISALHQGLHVYIAINKSPVLDILNESICKLIQQRYGYNYQPINDPTDVNYNDDSDFSIEGLFNFDNDNIRFIRITNIIH